MIGSPGIIIITSFNLVFFTYKNTFINKPSPAGGWRKQSNKAEPKATLEKGKSAPPSRQEVEVQTIVSSPSDLGISYLRALRKKTSTLQLVPTHKRAKIQPRKSTNKRQNKLSLGY